jgi:hypothetical protein
MNKIGLIIIINKFNHYFETQTQTWSCDTIDQARERLLDYLSDQFKNLNIDYPMELDDFEYIWFNKQYLNSNSFYYKIYNSGEWLEPWEHQEIYSDVLERMLAREQANPPDYSQSYGEPDPDEDTSDKFTMENEDMKDFENKIMEMMDKSKLKDQEVELEDEVKPCHCEKCVQQDETRKNEIN